MSKQEFYKVVKSFFEVKRKKKFLRQTIPKLFFTTLTLSIGGRERDIFLHHESGAILLHTHQLPHNAILSNIFHSNEYQLITLEEWGLWRFKMQMRCVLFGNRNLLGLCTMKCGYFQTTGFCFV